MGRRRRIARGSGQEVNAVNELLKSFKSMKQVMKEMNKLGLGARFGLQAKKEALRGLSPDGLSAGGGESPLDALFGGGPRAGRGAGLPGGLGGLGGPRPMGSSATRQSGSKRKDKKRKKKRR